MLVRRLLMKGLILAFWGIMAVAVCQSTMAQIATGGTADTDKPAAKAPEEGEETKPTEPPALPESRIATEQALEKLLNELGAFFKSQKDDQGRTSFVIVWESDGATSKINLSVRDVGTYGGAPVYTFYAWTSVMSGPTGEPLSPSIIKTVVAENDLLNMGFYSMSSSLDGVYSIATGTTAGLSVGDMWMNLAYCHKNMIDLKKKVESLDSSK